MKKLLYYTLVCCAIAACSQKSNDSHPMDTLRVDVGSEAPTLDPQKSEDTTSSRIMYDFFAGLADFDQKNNPIPGMAQSWNISADGKTIVFNLRKDLKFSNGDEITAKDFVYTFQRLVDPKTASNYNYLLSTVVNGQKIIDGKAPASSLGVEAKDKYTFIVHLAQRDPDFILKCTMPNLYVVDQKVIEKYGDQWTNPEHIVTSGAYVEKEHVVNGYILATKNKHYYDAKNVSIEQVKYFPYVDTNASLSAYRSGGLDMTFQAVPVDQVKQIKVDYPKEFHTVLQEATYYYDFNMQLPKFKNNLNLRKALSMAIDRNQIVKDVMGNEQIPLYSVVTDTVAGGAYKGLNYDWEKWPRAKQIAMAKQLYKEAGYGPNHPLQITITYNTNDGHKKLALAVGSMWKNVLGVQTKIQNQDWKTFLEARHKGNYDVARDGWVADYNSVNAYTPLYTCNGPQNNSHYCSAKYDKLLAQANAASGKESVELFRQALTIALNDYAIIPMYQYTYNRLVKPYVMNYQIETNYLDHVQSKWFKFKS